MPAPDPHRSAPAAGPAGETEIHTGAAGLYAGMVSIPAGDGRVAAYRAVPAEARRAPVLLVVSEIFGLHRHVADLVRRFAHLGYLAIAPELFARQGDPSRYTEVERLMAEVVGRVPDAQVMAAGGEAARRSRIEVYPQAPHAFMADYRPSYRAAPARDGWRRCLDWLEAHGVA